MSDVAEDLGADCGVAPVPGRVLDKPDAEFVGGAFETKGDHFFFLFFVGGAGGCG